MSLLFCCFVTLWFCEAVSFLFSRHSEASYLLSGISKEMMFAPFVSIVWVKYSVCICRRGKLVLIKTFFQHTMTDLKGPRFFLLWPWKLGMISCVGISSVVNPFVPAMHSHLSSDVRVESVVHQNHCWISGRTEVQGKFNGGSNVILLFRSMPWRGSDAGSRYGVCRLKKMPDTG